MSTDNIANFIETTTDLLDFAVGKLIDGEQFDDGVQYTKTTFSDFFYLRNTPAIRLWDEVASCVLLYYNNKMEYRKQSHCVYYIRYHIVISTKYRRKIIVKGVKDYLLVKLEEIRRIYPEVVIVEANTEADHLHVLVSIPPKMSVSDFVRILKSNTANGLKKRFKFLKKVYWGTESIWSIGFFVSTIGVNESVIRKYIEMQEKEDTGQAKLELD